MNKENRRKSTIIRHNVVHEAYKNVVVSLGEYAHLVPKSHIYDLVQQQTGLCTKTIAYILNHTSKNYPP